MKRENDIFCPECLRGPFRTNPVRLRRKGMMHTPEGVGLDLMCRSLSHQVKGYSLCGFSSVPSADSSELVSPANGRETKRYVVTGP